MLNHKGEVAECTGDNIFIVSRGVLKTPSAESGILEGITRNAVIRLARDAKICTNPETYHSDIMAACRYAHHGAYHYLNKPAPPPEDDDARRKRQWLQKQKMLKDPWRKGMSGWAG